MPCSWPELMVVKLAYDGAARDRDPPAPPWWLSLPAAPDALASSPTTPPPTSRRIPHVQRELRALVVEDDPATLRTYQRILLRRGVVVSGASSAEEALQTMSTLSPELRPSVVFLDVVLPTLTGGVFVAELRRLPGSEQVPVVLVSALHLSALRSLVTQWGANGFVQKTRGLLQLELVFDQWVRHISDRTA